MCFLVLVGGSGVFLLMAASLFFKIQKIYI